MNKVLALIDADGLAYHALRETLEKSLIVLDEKIQNIFEKTQCTHYCMFISKEKYFRHEISKGTYKANRNKYQRQNWVKTLKAVLEDKYGATYMLGVEADDLVNYWYHQDLCIADDGKIEPKDIFESTLMTIRESPFYTEDQEFTFEPLIKIICSADKDILQGIAGNHFDYSYRLEEKGNPDSVIKGSWVETSDKEALLSFWKSMICGDVADNISGIPGRGIKFAEKLFFNIDDEQSLMNLTLEEYIEKYGTSQGVYEFQKNFRQLYILQTNEDFLREVGQLPELPEIREVILNSQIEKLDDDLTF